MGRVTGFSQSGCKVRVELDDASPPSGGGVTKVPAASANGRESNGLVLPITGQV